MATYVSRLHHISFHITNVDNIAYDLVSKFKFNLFATRLTERSRQLAFRKGAAVFVVNGGSNQPPSRYNGNTTDTSSNRKCNDVRKCDKDSHLQYLYDVNPEYFVDTACNVCFEVEDVERSFKSLRDQGCDFLVPPTVVHDERGHVTYSVVKSIVGNVCHTLIDTTKYEGSFLPGFDHFENVTSNGLEQDNSSCSVTHFDHITYACQKKTTPQVMQWYERLFGFQRFFIDG